MITVKRKVNFVRREKGRKAMVDKPSPPSTTAPGRIPRIARLMALAIRFDRLIREGRVTDMSELARLAHVTQPRMTQIMNLNHLAPDIQETMLFLPSKEKGRESIFERTLRPITLCVDWQAQRCHLVTQSLLSQHKAACHCDSA